MYVFSIYCINGLKIEQIVILPILTYVDQSALLALSPFCFPKQSLVFTCLLSKSFENTAGKGEIARNEQFLLFPQCFSTHLENFLLFSSNLKLSSANSVSLGESKICRLGKG